MANDLNQIVSVQINVNEAPISQEGFGTPLYLGESNKINVRTKSYANLTEVAADFDTTDPEYKMAEAGFSQVFVPPRIVIGKRVNTIAVSAITQATTVSGNIVNINATNIGFDAEVDASITVSGFNEAAYNGTFLITDIIDNDNIRYTAASAPLTTPATGSGSYTLSETWTNAVQKCYDFDSSWYGLAISSNVEADILEVAAITEALGRIFVARTSDANVFDANDATNLFAILKGFSYKRTLAIYNADTVDYFIDAAILGRMLPTLPGSSNWAYKTLAGIPVDSLTEAQKNAVTANNGNYYTVLAGRNITFDGRTPAGEYIDITRGEDWIVARIQENIALAIFNNEKLPYTNEGGEILGNKIRRVLETGANNGLIARNDKSKKGLYTVTVPDVTTIQVNDRLARVFSGITFRAELAGAINAVAITGTLTI